MNSTLRIFFFLGIFAASLPFYAQPLSTTSKKAAKYHDEATRYFESGNNEEALALILKALDKDPKFVEGHMLKAYIHLGLNDPEKAIAAFETALQINPHFFPANYAELGGLYYKTGQYAKAIETLEYYLKTFRPKEESRRKAQYFLDCSVFSKTAIENPVEFNPVNLGPTVNSELRDYNPLMNLEGNQLYFTRTIPHNVPSGAREDIYIAFLDQGKYTQTLDAGRPLNTQMREGAPALTADGQSMIITICESYGNYGPQRNGYGSCDLFLTRLTDRGWDNPRNLGPVINSQYFDSQASISSDGKTIYFSSSRPGGYGKSDIYYSNIINGKLTPPKNIGNTINTEGAEEGVFIHPDNQTLYFTSTGHIGLGGSDIYFCRREIDGTWGKPQNLGYPINTKESEWGLTIDASGKKAFFSSDREGGLGEMDIYEFQLPEKFQAKPVTYFKGVVFDNDTKKPLEAQFDLIDVDSKEVIYSANSQIPNGDFFLCLPAGKSYALNVKKEGYLFYSDHFELQQSNTALEPFKKNIPLKPIKKGVPVVLKNIFFDTDKYDLKQKSIAELEILYRFLQENPTLKIEVAGHTDNQGDLKHNLALSQNRAKTVVDYLVQKGIASDRLTAKGYGPQKPVATNETPEGRAQNRRTEFSIQ